MATQLDSTLQKSDIDLLNKAIQQWEKEPAQFLALLSVLRGLKKEDAPVEAQEHWESFEEFRSEQLRKEKDTKKERDDRRRRAVFLKAKLLLIQEEQVASSILSNGGEFESDEEVENENEVEDKSDSDDCCN